MESEKLNFWFLGHHISVRVEGNVKKELDMLSRKNETTRTVLIDFAIRNFLDKYANKSDKKTNEFMLLIKKNKDLKYLRKVHKEKRYCRYIIKNTHKTLYEQQRSFWFNSGKLNMKLVNKTIDEAKAEFNHFPKDVRDDLKEEMGYLENFRNPDFLLGKISVFKYLEHDKKRK